MAVAERLHLCCAAVLLQYELSIEQARCNTIMWWPGPVTAAKKKWLQLDWVAVNQHLILSYYYETMHLAGIAIRRMSARTSCAFAVFSWFQLKRSNMWYDAGHMQYGGCQGHVKIRSKSLTFNDLGSPFRVLHVSRTVFGADFEFSIQFNI